MSGTDVNREQHVAKRIRDARKRKSLRIRAHSALRRSEKLVVIRPDGTRSDVMTVIKVIRPR